MQGLTASGGFALAVTKIVARFLTNVVQGGQLMWGPLLWQCEKD